MAGFDKEMWQDFLVEVDENLQEFEPNLLLLEQHPKDRGLLDDCFRNMHSIKGAANYMGFKNIATLAHKIENLMDASRKGEHELEQKSFDLIFKGVDTLRALLKDIERNKKETLNIDDFLNDLQKILNKEEKVENGHENISSSYDVEEEAEDQELLNIFQEEIESQFNQLQMMAEEKEMSLEDVLFCIDSMIRITNYMAREKSFDELKALKNEIKDKGLITKAELNGILERIREIFKDDVELKVNDIKKEFVTPSFEEDQELYSIFIDFFKEIGTPLSNIPNEFDPSWAQECQGILERLKNSANYMDYMEIVNIFEEWEEKLAEVLSNKKSYNKEDFYSLWNQLLSRLPGLDELFKKDVEEKATKGHETETLEINDESLDLFESAIENLIDSQAAKVLPEITEKDESGVIGSIQEGIEPLQVLEEPYIEESEKRQETVRVNLSKVETLLEDVAELVVLRSSMATNTKVLKEIYSLCLEKRLLPTKELRKLKEVLLGFSEDVSGLERIVHQLQDGVMRIRMLPVAHLFNRFPRLVRDLGRRLGKEVELVLSGTDTALDKQVMEKLFDPLQHIVRNALDHGIESPEERARLGKPQKGRIILSATQEGNFVVIKISDDGKGLDTDKIIQKALELGVVSKDRIASLNKDEFNSLIFAPGVSTASEVSDISGRGVGLDVVRKNIENIGGTISVKSSKNKGTTISLRIPLTLAIIKGLVVKVGIQSMVVPISSIQETFKVDESEISSVEGYEIISRRQETLPLIRLNKIFRGTGRKENGPGFYAVRVKLSDVEACLGVDRLVGQQEVVIKPLSEYLMDQPGFSGATILGDGSIALILDLSAVLDKAKGFIKKKQRLLEQRALGIDLQEGLFVH